jgi:NADP-dependent 3-hydroxy acid dehydrogenase YdfG
MKNIFKDKVVIVTGASSGIGEASAREFARNGSKVVLAARSEEKLASIVEKIKSDNGTACFIKTDVSNEDDCRKLVEKAVSEWYR